MSIRSSRGPEESQNQKKEQHWDDEMDHEMVSLIGQLKEVMAQMMLADLKD
jgi:hypothetical protein